MESKSAIRIKPTYTADYKKSPAFDNKTRLVLGTSGLGGVWGGIDINESADALLYALENGVQAFDSAPSYADAEIVLGQALKQWKGEKPFISTKVGRVRADDAHTTVTDYSSEGIKRSFDDSLEKIGVDYLDLLFLHEPQLVKAEDIPRILELLQGFHEEGLIGKIGIGGNLTQAFRPYMGPGKFEVISGFLEMNACNLDAFTNDVPFIKENKLAYYNASILHFGLLATRLPTYKENFESESAWLQRKDIAVAEDLIELAKNYDMELSMLAQRYAFGIAEADRIVAGAKNQRQIQRTISDWEQGPLPEEQFEEVTNLILKHY